MDLDEAAGRLYGLPPARFTAERDALARAAKDAGDGPLARTLGTLRRPTVSAWAVNQVARAHPAELAELLDLGARLRQAWQDQDPGPLAELTRARGPLTTRLTRLIRDLAAGAGQSLSGSAQAEIERTLDAATVDGEAADQVRQGRLARPLNYSGFTPAPAPTRPVASREKPAAAKPAGRKPSRQERSRRDREQQDRRRAERAEAARKAEAAERDHAEWAAELESAARERDGLAARVDELARELAAARDHLATAEHRHEAARRDERRARRTATAARLKADEAAAALRS